MILEQIDKRINTVSTSSLGRVFDAVAALLGLGNYNHFDAQLPMALESLAEPGVDDRYEFDLLPGGEPLQLDLRRTLKGVVEDLRSERKVAVVSAKFHNTLAEALLAMAQGGPTEHRTGDCRPERRRVLQPVPHGSSDSAIEAGGIYGIMEP